MDGLLVFIPSSLPYFPASMFMTSIACLLLLQMLADNLIERLPINLGKLQSLKVASLDKNRITTLPDECKCYFRFKGICHENLLSTCSCMSA